MPPNNNIRSLTPLPRKKSPASVNLPAAYNVSRSAISALPGVSVQFFAQLVNRNGSPLAIAGRSLTASIVAGSGGTLTASEVTTNAQGIAQITLTVGTVVGTIYRVKVVDEDSLTGTSPNVTIVADTTAASILVAPSTLALTAGLSSPLTAVFKNAAGSTVAGTVTGWHSSNTAVATVSSSGLVTAIAAGSATITATNGTLTSNACTVTAAAAPVIPPVDPGTTPETLDYRLYRTDGLATSVPASLILMLRDDAAHALINTRVLKAGVEQAILTPVVTSIYESGRPKTAYTELVLAGAHGAVDLVVSFGSPRTVSAIATRVYGSNEDPTTHQLPLAMMENPRTMGHAPAFCLPTSADYMTSCGAFPRMVTVAAVPSIPGVNLQRVAKYWTSFDTFLRDWHWSGHSNAPLHIVPSNTAYNGTTDLSSLLNGSEDISDANWSGPRPPARYNWRAAAGVVGFGGGQNYYGADRIFFQAFLRTADVEYFIRACWYAETCRHYSRWTVHREGAIGFVRCEVPTGAWQLEGLAYAYQLTGNPDHKALIESLIDALDAVQGDPNPAYIGQQVGSVVGNGEPRNMERITDGYLQLVLCATTTLERAARKAKLDAHLPRVIDAESWTYWQASLYDGSMEEDTWAVFGDGAICQSDPVHPKANTFMQVMVDSALIKCYEQGGLSTDVKAAILARVAANMTKVKNTFWAAGIPGVCLGSFLNGFTGACVFPDQFARTQDLNNMYTHTIAWLAWRTADPTWLAFFHEVFNAAVGDDGVFDGSFGPFIWGLKQSREQYCSSQLAFYPLLQASA